MAQLSQAENIHAANALFPRPPRHCTYVGILSFHLERAVCFIFLWYLMCPTGDSYLLHLRLPSSEAICSSLFFPCAFEAEAEFGVQVVWSPACPIALLWKRGGISGNVFELERKKNLFNHLGLQETQDGQGQQHLNQDCPSQSVMLQTRAQPSQMVKILAGSQMKGLSFGQTYA